ncbi:MAG: response regulator [Acidobacteria bacterium]|nr:response regulator [Acidobacteriota bacterium]
MLVEDEPSNVELFTAVLERDGYAVESVTDGRQVEQRVDAFRPDLVLMDINLPGVDGAELLRRLRRDPSTAGLRILAVTAHAMKGDAESFVAMGFDGYIPKPIEVKRFRAIVRRVLEGPPVRP